MGIVEHERSLVCDATVFPSRRNVSFNDLTNGKIRNEQWYRLVMIEESRATNSIIVRRRNNARVTRVLPHSGSSHDKPRKEGRYTSVRSRPSPLYFYDRTNRRDDSFIIPTANGNGLFTIWCVTLIIRNTFPFIHSLGAMEIVLSKSFRW